MSKINELNGKLDQVSAEIQDAYRTMPDIQLEVSLARWEGPPLRLSKAIEAESQHTRLIKRLEREERELHRLIRLEETRAKKPEMTGVSDPPMISKTPSIADDFVP